MGETSDPGKQLLHLLDSLEESPRFCTSGSADPVLPGLEVPGLETIGLPIAPAVARQLIEHAVQAPYGRGEETILDTDVRRVWQIEPGQFALRNSAWDAFISRTVEAVQTDFAIDREVKHDLYKLLIYEKGSFFAPHRDTEKVDGMFATLVVTLPSRHEGGELVVTHDGQTEELAFGGPQSEFQIQYAAFYADCRHEIRPVTRGYRVCLVYNLALAGRQRQPHAPRSGDKIDRAAELLPAIFADPSRNKIAIPLKHEYTEAGLSFAALKGQDRSRVQVLQRAAEQAGCRMYLALMTLYQVGSAEYSGYSYYGDDENDVEMGEVIDEEITLEHFLDPSGGPAPVGNMTVEEDEILSEEPVEEWPCKQEVEEATGNAGATVERWYRQAMIVLWPEDRFVRIVAAEGPAVAVPALADMVASSSDPATDAECRRFAEAIVDDWGPTRFHHVGRESVSAAMLTQLERIADGDLVRRFLRGPFVSDHSGGEGKVLAKIGGRLGWKAIAADLAHFVASQLPSNSAASLKAVTSVVEGLCTAPGKITADRKSACRAVAEELVAVIKQWDTPSDRSSWRHEREPRQGVVESLFRVLDAVEAPEPLNEFVEHVLSDAKHYGLHEMLIPAVKTIHPEMGRKSAGYDAYQRLLRRCIEALESRTATPIAVPQDWAQKASFKCKCALCSELGEFLRDPKERVHRFRARQDLRSHVECQIVNHHCDVDCATERKGTPHTLVCTKNRASYEQRKKEFKTDVKLLGELRALAPKRTR